MERQRLYDDDTDREGSSGGGQMNLLGDESSGDTPPEAAPEAKPATPDPALSAMERRLLEQDQRLSEMQAALTARPSGQQAQPNQPDEASRAAIAQQFWENPVTSADIIAQRRIQEAVQAIGAQQYPRDRRLAMQAAREADPDVWSQYGTEIEQYVQSNYQPQHHTNEHVWSNALEVIRGRHAFELAEAKMKKRKAGGPAEPSLKGQGPNAKPSDSLDDDEKAVASDIFLISEERYKKGREFARAQDRRDDRLGSKMLKSAWAKETYTDRDGMVRPLITFDSEIQKPRPATRSNN